MSTGTGNMGLQYLSVAEAAEALGISRMRVREAAELGAIPSLRDNEGRLRLNLSETSAPFAPPGLTGSVASETLLDMLFDEVEDLQAAQDDAGREVETLSDLVGRQASALERAEALLDLEKAQKAKLVGLLDRALAQLDARDADAARMASVTDRTMTALEQTVGRLETSIGQTARFESLLARAVDHAQTARAAPDGPETATAMADTAERAMAMLDQAMAEAEGGRKAAAQTGAMLDRALAAGERMERQIADRDAAIEDRTAAAERALDLSERAVALAGPGGPPSRKGFWRRLFGL